MASQRPALNVVDLSPEPLLDDGTMIQPMDDGTISVDLDGAPPAPLVPIEHGDNLVDIIDPNELATLADDVLDWVDADIKSREPWLRRFRQGLKTAGIIESDNEVKPSGVLEHINEINHPLLLEACVQFQSRAIAELYPPGGPVKAKVNGRNTQELLEQSERVKDYMNYEITTLDKTYFWDTDKMLMVLPLVGSAFKKTFHDPIRKVTRSVLCQAENVIVPYAANSIHTTPRITHRIPMSHTELQRYQATGFYADTPLAQPNDPYQDERTLVDEADNREISIADEDAEHILFETTCDYDFPSLGDSEDGIPLPYVITVDRETRTVLGVRRNWRESDPDRTRRNAWTHYQYLPGLGFYGFGLIHAMGGLSDACTALVRAIITAGAYASMPGGFKARNSKMKGDITIEPGLWKDIDMDYEDLQKMLWSPTFRDPSAALVGMLEKLTEAGQRFGSTTEAMVGEANNAAPVGTTLALIEQGSKIYSAIHKRCHVAAGEEFQIRFEVIAEHLPEEYPYMVGDITRTVMRIDFNDRVSVEPVSDPNIVSSTQRIAIAQGVLELSKSAPQMYDTYEAHRRMLEAMQVPDIDKVLPNPNVVPHADPVSEGSYLIVGKPVRAHYDEDHQAHMIVHQAQAAVLQSLPPQQAQVAMAALTAHIAEHMAMMYRLQMSAQLGIELPAIDLAGKDREEQPTEIGNQLAVMAGMLIQQQAMQQQAIAQAQAAQQGQPQTQPGQNPEATQIDPAQQAQQRFEQQQQHKDQALQADLQRNQLKDAAKFLQSKGAQDIPPAALVETSQTLGRNFDEALKAIRVAQAQGQGVGPFPQTADVMAGHA